VVVLAGTAGAAVRAPLKPSTRGAYFGSYVPPKEWTEAGQKKAIRRFEDAIGRRLDIVNMYYAWEKEFPNWREPWHLEDGRIPMISWNGTSTAAILSGRYDSMIRERADAVAGLDGRVFLRFFWEMDGSYKQPWVGSPRKFVAAWRHVHRIFENRGATNVAWVWTPNAWAFWTGEAMRYYPGDRYVDWAGGDGYNWGGSGWRGFGSIFRAMYEVFEGRKPMMVAETGAIERGGSKARWIDRCAYKLRNRFPQIRAFVWFNSIDGRFDFRMNTSRASLRAFRSMARMSYFRPRH
jgi:hypothetical protein